MLIPYHTKAQSPQLHAIPCFTKSSIFYCISFQFGFRSKSSIYSAKFTPEHFSYTQHTSIVHSRSKTLPSIRIFNSGYTLWNGKIDWIFISFSCLNKLHYLFIKSSWIFSALQGKLQCIRFDSSISWYKCERDLIASYNWIPVNQFWKWVF